MKIHALITGIAVLFMTTATAHDLYERDADWIFRCSETHVYIYDHRQLGFTVRNLEPPFQLAWTEAREPVLTVGNEKCELIYPVEQG